MKILVAGDFVPQNRIKPLIESKNYAELFDEVKPIIEQVDYSIINLECPICLGDYKPIYKQGPNLQARTKNAVEALKYAGFDMVTLANNHILDYGEDGLHDTMQVCQEYGIDMVGAGMNLREASNVFYKQINEKTLAVINCCEHEFSIATDTTGGSNPLNAIQQYYQIQEARKKADYVIVIVHGGHEHYQLPSPRMQETYRFFVDAGADAVVNHHQHCFSGKEIYKSKPIYYGLGNFCFDYGKRNDIWHQGFMLELDFKTKGFTTKEIAYIQCYNEPKVAILADTDGFSTRFKELSETIGNEEKLKKEVSEYYKIQSKFFEIFLEPYTNRYMRKLRRLGLIPSMINKRKLVGYLNYINCDSHRDKLLYFLHRQTIE